VSHSEACPSFTQFLYLSKGVDAHVESEFARIGCLLSCWYVRQE
jgi:hypothetical protein